MSGVVIEVDVSDSQLDAEIAKLQQLEKGNGSNVSSGVDNTTESDEYAGYYDMRKQQRNSMFSDGDIASKSGMDALNNKSLLRAGMSLAQGEIPTNQLLRQALGIAGVSGTAGMLAISGIDLVIKKIVEIQAREEFDRKMKEYENRRKLDYQSAYRGVMTG